MREAWGNYSRVRLAVTGPMRRIGGMAMMELPHTAGCLVCGRSNPIGMHLSLHVDGDGAVRTSFTPSPRHIGFDGLIHGGVLATVLDEAMVWSAIWASKRACVAGEMNIRFRLPARVDQPLTCIAKVTLNRSRMIEATGELLDAAGQIVAAATGKYMPQAADQTIAFQQSLMIETTTDSARQILIRPQMNTDGHR